MKVERTSAKDFHFFGGNYLWALYYESLFNIWDNLSIQSPTCNAYLIMQYAMSLRKIKVKLMTNIFLNIFDFFYSNKFMLICYVGKCSLLEQAK